MLLSRNIRLGPLLLLLLWSWPCGGAAQPLQWLSTTNYLLASNAVTPSELWILAEDIAIHGTAADDLFLMASGGNFLFQSKGHGHVNLAGTLSNDVWAFGQVITLDGTVMDHARLAALQGISIQGKVQGGLLAFGQTIAFTPQADVGGEVLLNGGRITLAGTFRTNVHIIATEEITVTPATVLEGQLEYSAPRELVLDPSVTHRGKLIRTRPQVPSKDALYDAWFTKLAFFMGALLVGFAALAFFPAFISQSVQNLHQAHWKCLLAGGATFFFTPILALFAIVMLIGVPLGILLIGGYLILMYLSKFIVAFLLGGLICRRFSPNPPLFPALLLGLIIVFIATNLPSPLGLMVWCWIALIGMGAMVLTLKDRRVPVLVAQPQSDAGTKPPPPPPAGTGHPPS